MGMVGLAYLLPKPYRPTAVLYNRLSPLSQEKGGCPWLRKEPDMKFSDIPSLLSWLFAWRTSVVLSLNPSLLPFPSDQFSCTLSLRADNSLLLSLD